MEDGRQEGRVPNFIGNAVIILTAGHLGCEVEMLSTAREVWRSRPTALERYFTGQGNSPRTESKNTKKTPV